MPRKALSKTGLVWLEARPGSFQLIVIKWTIMVTLTTREVASLVKRGLEWE